MGYRISSGGTEILDWTAQNTTSASKNNLNLINGESIISARAIDKAGNKSALATSDGVKADFSSITPSIYSHPMMALYR